jgi:large subunit ribosomal protein L25
VSNVLQAKERTEFRRSALTNIRREGNIPAVVYGVNMEAKPIYVNGPQFFQVIKKVGRNGLMSLDLNGKRMDVMLNDYQEDPISKDLVHLDLLAVDMTREINAMVRVDLVGDPAGVRDGGVLQQPLFEISITSTPANVPSAIEVDITGLGVNETLTIGDIKGNYSFKINHEDDETVASILPPKQEDVISTGEKQSEGVPEKLEVSEETPESKPEE